MKMTRNISLLFIAALVFGLYSALFTVNQTQQALVLQLGEPKRIIRSRDFRLKSRLFRMQYFTSAGCCRLSARCRRGYSGDQKRLQVDAYARYVSKTRYCSSRQCTDEFGARARRINYRFVWGDVCWVVRHLPQSSQVSARRLTGRSEMKVNSSVKSLGIEIIDVRLRRADYPQATSQNIFNRMKSEREEAKEFRATGEEEAQKIRADAEGQEQ